MSHHIQVEGGAFHVAGDGEFSELYSITSGTGAFAGATGQVYGNGTAVNGAGNGAYFGKVCAVVRVTRKQQWRANFGSPLLFVVT
jgi:hypothetical protein